MTVVLGNLCRAVPLHQALREKVESFFPSFKENSSTTLDEISIFAEVACSG